jgi:hypothetical protein
MWVGHKRNEIDLEASQRLMIAVEFTFLFEYF